MDLDYVNEFLARMEADWPNHVEVFDHWFSKCKVVMFYSDTPETLPVLQSRLPEPYASADAMTLREWFDADETVKALYVDKVLFLVVKTIHDQPFPTPMYAMRVADVNFFQNFESGVFVDISDKTNERWTEGTDAIVNYTVLNPESEESNHE